MFVRNLSGIELVLLRNSLVGWKFNRRKFSVVLVIVVFEMMRLGDICVLLSVVIVYFLKLNNVMLLVSLFVLFMKLYRFVS